MVVKVRVMSLPQASAYFARGTRDRDASNGRLRAGPFPGAREAVHHLHHAVQVPLPLYFLSLATVR